MRARDATPDDLPALVRVINAAYLVEQSFVTGDRTHEEELREMLRRPGAAFLVVEDGEGDVEGARELAGAVYVELRGARAYFGMLSVHPARQGRGIGRLLVGAAERWGRDAGCRFVDISVVDLRTDLVPFYARLGYAPYDTAPFPQPGRLTRQAGLVLMTKPLVPLWVG
jgi:GNAT superfamily N-acetyltransferase